MCAPSGCPTPVTSTSGRRRSVSDADTASVMVPSANAADRTERQRSPCWRPGVSGPHGPAAVDEDFCSAAVRRVIGRQECGYGGDLAGLADPAQRRLVVFGGHDAGGCSHLVCHTAGWIMLTRIPFGPSSPTAAFDIASSADFVEAYAEV